jgi:hypothetical protein
MAEDNGPDMPPSHPLRWFPEFLEFGKARFRSQGRVLPRPARPDLLGDVLPKAFAATT